MKQSPKKVKKYKSKNKDLVKYFLLFGGAIVVVLLALVTTAPQTLLSNLRMSFETRSRAAVEAPQITSVSPSSTYPNQQITINGKKFGTQKKCLCFKVGNITKCSEQMSTISSWTDTKITAKVIGEPAIIGTGLTFVQKGDACEIPSNETILTINPYISSVSPKSVYPYPASGKVSITGYGFGTNPGKACFTAGGKSDCSGATFTGGNFVIDSWSTNKVVLGIHSDPPVRGGGTLKLTIQPYYLATAGTATLIPGPMVVSNAVSFSILPWLSSISPGSAAPGKDITLYGSGFGSQKNRLCFIVSGKVDCSVAMFDYIYSWADNKIKVRVGTNPPIRGSGVIKVKAKTITGTEVDTNPISFTIP